MGDLVLENPRPPRVVKKTITKIEVKEVVKEVEKLVYQTKLKEVEVVKYKYVPNLSLNTHLLGCRIITVLALCVIAILLVL